MSVANKLDKASGTLFALGLLSSKFRYLPLSYLSAIGNLLSLSFYLIGYFFWALAAYLYPLPQEVLEKKSPSDSKWMLSNLEFFLAALIGLIAVCSSIASLLYPALFLPSLWLFAASNVFWSIGQKDEVSRLEAKKDEGFTKANSYLSYALWGTILSLVNAIYASLLLTLPLPSAVIVVLTVSQTLSAIMAFRHWYSYTFGGGSGPKPDSPDPRKTGRDDTSKLETVAKTENNLTPNEDLKPQPYQPFSSSVLPRVVKIFSPCLSFFSSTPLLPKAPGEGESPESSPKFK